jgi:hypothetical protein
MGETFGLATVFRLTWTSVAVILATVSSDDGSEAVARAEAVAEHRLLVRHFEPRVVLRAEARVRPVFADEAPLRQLDAIGCMRAYDGEEM